jgi:hypothetical protein
MQDREDYLANVSGHAISAIEAACDDDLLEMVRLIGSMISTVLAEIKPASEQKLAARYVIDRLIERHAPGMYIKAPPRPGGANG